MRARLLRERHAQHDGRWFRVWVGLSFRSLLLGASLMPDSGLVVGIGFLYVGVGGYDRD